MTKPQETQANAVVSSHDPREASTCQVIDWYSEGESKVVQVAGVRVEVRFIGRSGRRGRISITAPVGSVIQSEQRDRANSRT